MKTINAMANLAIAAYMVATLAACSKTNNSDSSPAAATPASTCSQSWDGTLRDQYGRTCSNYQNGGGNCVNSRFNPATNSYVDINTGAPVNCNPNGYFGGGNSVPYYGTTYQGQSFQGCQGWSQVYNATYIPVDLGNGQLVCMNIAYLGQVYPQVNQYPASYYYSQPIYVCSGADCGGGGGYYSGGGYYGGGCQASVNLGYYSGDSGASLGLCL